MTPCAGFQEISTRRSKARGFSAIEASKFGLRLNVNINTVITRDNLDEMLPLAEWIFSERPCDGHYFNFIRGAARDTGPEEAGQGRTAWIYGDCRNPVALCPAA